MPELLLVRHGETALNQERRWQGQHDASLTPRGQAEAQALAERIAAAHPVALYSSDLPRARETAAAITRLTALEPALDARWREVDVGEWLGRTPAEVEFRHPEGYARWLAGGTGWERGGGGGWVGGVGAPPVWRPRAPSRAPARGRAGRSSASRTEA